MWTTATLSLSYAKIKATANQNKAEAQHAAKIKADANKTKDEAQHVASTTKEEFCE